MRTFEQAAARQYRYSTRYVVWLVAPDGTKTELGDTSRKSGRGLLNMLQLESVRANLLAIPGMETARCFKHADRLDLTNGYVIRFGDTIRRESV